MATIQPPAPKAARPTAGHANGHAAAQAAGQPTGQTIWPTDTSDRPLIWVNGQMLPKSKAMVSVYDHGLLYGDGIFEGIRVYKGKIFKCKSHLDRIYRNAERLHMMRQNGGASMPFIQRVTVTVLSPWVTSNGASATWSLPMLEPCTKASWVRSIKLSTTSR